MSPRRFRQAGQRWASRRASAWLLARIVSAGVWAYAGATDLINSLNLRPNYRWSLDWAERNLFSLAYTDRGFGMPVDPRRPFRAAG
jgi:hypothetical protein